MRFTKVKNMKMVSREIEKERDGMLDMRAE